MAIPVWQVLGCRQFRIGLAQDRVLAPGLDHKVQDHVPGPQRILASGSVGWQSSCSFSFRRDRRAKSPQETVNAGLCSRFGANWTDVRPIQKREFCFCHDGTFIALADTPREYCDRCVGDRVHKKVVLIFWALKPLPVTHPITITEFQDFSRQNNDHHFAVRLRTQRDPQLLLAVARAE